MALQSLILPIVSLFRSAGITQARNAIGGLNKDLKGLASSVGKAAGSFAAFQAITGSRQFLLEAVENTQQFERNMLALGQVFEGLTPQMDRFTQSVREYGIGQNQAAQASVFIGSVLKQYGFGVDEAADATQRIVKLAQDLATTYGYDVSEALLATTALFRGEFDPIEKFGVAMKQNEINAELLARGYGDLTGAQRENQEAIITLDFLFERAADSVGAFTRATDTLYAAQKRLEAGILNLQIALGEPLQGPLADVTNAFATLVEDYGPEIEDLGRTIAEGLQNAAPTIEAFGKLLFELTGPLQFLLEVVETIGSFLTEEFALPILEAATGVLDTIGDVLASIVITAENGQSSVEKFFNSIGLTDEQIDDLTILDDFFAMVDRDLAKAGQDLKNYNYENDQTAKSIREAAYELTRFQLQADRSASALIELRKAAEQEDIENFKTAMRGLSVDARDAEGNLIGVAKIFADIDEAAAKSNAKAELEALNVEAGLIEAVLEEPNWQEIFGQIAKYARLAAIDISRLSLGAAAFVTNSMKEIADALPDLFDTPIDSGASNARNAVKDFFENLEDEIFKQKARIKMIQRGLPEPLIENILGNEDWLKIWIKILQSGEEGIKDLIDRWGDTAEGIDYATEQAKKFADEAKKIADIVDGIGGILEALVPEADIGRFESSVKRVLSGLRDEIKSLEAEGLISEQNAERLRGWVLAYEGILLEVAQKRDAVAGLIADANKKLEATKQLFLSPTDVANIVKPVALIEAEVSKFEQQVATSVAAIRAKIKQGADQSLIGLGTVRELNALADATHIALMSIARDRAALSKQYDELIRKQSDARLFRAATQEAIANYANVTQILKTATDQLASATSSSVKSTTEIISQTIKSARNFRDYRVVLVRDFIEPTAKAAAQASSITDGLRKVLEDTRLFATNLEKLRQLGLDPALFKQIVDSGMEAGNATAEAIIDGGPETVSEINSLYKEIQQVGAQAADLATETLFDGGEDMIQGVIDGILAKDAELAQEAAAIAQNLVDSFQGTIDEHVINIDNFIEELKAYESELIALGAELGQSFAAAFTQYVDDALKGIDVPVPQAPEVEVPETPELAPVLSADEIARIQSRINDITAIIASAMAAFEAADNDPFTAEEFMKDINKLRDERADLVRQLQEASAGANGGGTTINVNVKTDSTQSTAQVGRTITEAINKYTNTGGRLVTR